MAGGERSGDRVVWLRFLMAPVFASALLPPLRGLSLVRTSHWRWHLLRALMFVLMTGKKFWAIQYLQLASTSSIMFILPIITALLAGPAPAVWMGAAIVIASGLSLFARERRRI